MRYFPPRPEGAKGWNKRNGSTRAWRNARAPIFQRDGHICQSCGAPATHVDHILPLSQGGTDHPGNLQALCARCILAKS